MSSDRVTLARTAILTVSAALIVSPSTAPARSKHADHHARGKAGGAIAGAVYTGEPFSDDPFSLRVAKDGHGAKLVGTFTYTDPGCPDQAFGNMFLTASDAPKIKVASDGSFTGRSESDVTAENGAKETITRSVSGSFAGKHGSAEFKEASTCSGDTPLVIKVKLKAG